MNILHRIFKGHWPIYEYLGYDKYQCNIYDDECSVCKQNTKS